MVYAKWYHQIKKRPSSISKQKFLVVGVRLGSAIQNGVISSELCVTILSNVAIRLPITESFIHLVTKLTCGAICNTAICDTAVGWNTIGMSIRLRSGVFDLICRRVCVANILGSLNTTSSDWMILTGDLRGIGNVGRHGCWAKLEDRRSPLITLCGELLVLSCLRRYTTWKMNVWEDRVFFSDSNVNFRLRSDRLSFFVDLASSSFELQTHICYRYWVPVLGVQVPLAGHDPLPTWFHTPSYQFRGISPW